MILEIYTIRDVVVGTFGEFWQCQNRDVATRRFDYLMSTAPMVAADCQLFQIGIYDMESGCLKAFEHPEFVKSYEVHK